MESLRALLDRTPLRTKLIAAVLALVVIALAAISVTTTTVLRSYLIRQQDGNLSNTAAIALPKWVANPNHEAGTLYPFATGIYIAVQLENTPLTYPGIGPNGTIQNLPAPSIPANQAWANANRDKPLTVGSTSGHGSWRVIVEPVTLTSPLGTTQFATFVVAYNLGDVNAVIRQFVLAELTVGAVIVVVLAAVGAAVVQANLRPLNDIELTAGQIARGHLNHRIPERDPRTEIGSLGRSLNAMLAQIERAFHAQEKSERAAHESEERMRRFVADASHELRTPLTTIRGFAEYYRQRGGLATSTPSSRTDSGDSPATGGSLAPADIDQIMKRLESESSRMGLLVEDLLQLARLDQQRPLDLAPVDLLSLAADAVQDARMVAPDRPIDLQVAPGAAFIVDGDEPRLRQVIGNLVNNALTHTPAGTPVRVRLSTGPMDDSTHDGGAGGSAVVLDVEDDGPGLTAEQARHIFERFYRADAARGRESGGTGLGLAIVAGLVKAHGGTVSVKSAPGQGADFQVKLPLAS